jgi:hypothetical protein
VYDGIGKFLDCYCCNCLSDEDESEAKITLLQAYYIILPCDTTLFFYMSAFSTSCFVLSAMDSKIEQHICIKFCVKLGKFTAKTLEMLREAFGKHSLSQTVVFEWHSRFKAGRVSVEDDEPSR